jgi:hypothetical protein
VQWKGGLGLLRGRGIEQSATERELAGTMAVGEKAVVADAMEAVGECVEQEATDELMRGKRALPIQKDRIPL